MKMSNEPVAWAAVVRLGLVAAISFGLNLTDVQMVALMAFIEGAAALFTRSQVTPNGLAEERVAQGGSPTVPRE